MGLEKIPEAISSVLGKLFGSMNERVLDNLWPMVEEINELEPQMMKLSDSELRAKTDEFRNRLADGETLDDLLTEAFAVAREASRRVVRTPHEHNPQPMRHFDVQLLGGIVLHQGKIAEMTTGEGKTLVSNLAAYLNALTGKGVHIVTVNDFLARRDKEWMAPMYEFLGMTVGAIQANIDNEERQKAYACDVTYGTNNEFGFDYLRDNMKVSKETQAQKNLHFAIIDKVDSILIDEARTPLIISGPAEESTSKYYEADKIARRLKPDQDFEIKEKENQCTLTEEGIVRAQEFLNVDSFYTGQNMEWPHHIDQSLRAHHLFKRDQEYVVKNGEVIIVDEFTGRLMEGRRWSDGLHQAVEAKERLKIKEENQTLATITFQNFFRLYDKIAGMTGTAMTEAAEFHKIYELDVVSVPTNQTLIRTSHPDVVFRTAKEKYNAIEEEIAEVQATGRPVLVGTISIEKSEMLSRMLERRGIKHEVLNAKHHERESQIVAKAGQMGNVMIATNMAGRGTDIVLGEFEQQEIIEQWKMNDLAPKDINPSAPAEELEKILNRFWAEKFLSSNGLEKFSDEELRQKLERVWNKHGMSPLQLCTKVADLGGLHIVGTERHEARRIDNQLRGRSGRQGDPGSSRFFVSLEDDLMRIFASERVSSILQRIGMEEGMAIEHSWVSKTIERAQKKREEHNFDIRKSLLEYDEVMDEQRKIIYSQRQQILDGESVRQTILEMIEDRVLSSSDNYLTEDPPDYKNMANWATTKFGIPFTESELTGKSKDEAENHILDKLSHAYAKREKELGEETMRNVERFLLLQMMDSRWKDHLYAMDHLKSGIGLRGYAQVDPKIEYKREGYQMFDQLWQSVKNDVTGFVLKMRVQRDDEPRVRSLWHAADFAHAEFSGDMSAQAQRYQSDQEQAAEAAQRSQAKPEPLKADKKVGRNEPCPCGSGKKYKKCCGGAGR